MVIVLLLPAIALGAELAPDAKVLKIVGSTTVRLCMDCGPQRVSFPVTVVPEAKAIALKKDERPRVISVSTGGTRIQRLEQRLTSSWEPPTGRPQLLVLTIDPALRESGTYDIEIDLLPQTRPRAPAEIVKVVVGAATLEGPDKLIVHRTRGLILSNNLHATPLVLFETGRQSGVEKLDVHAMTFVHTNKPLDGTVFSRRASNVAASGVKESKGASSLTLAAGDRFTIEYDISDDVPYGLTSGSVRVMAPEVAKALVIPVEIRDVLSREYLALVIVIGLVLSYLVKVALHNRLQRSRARAAAATLLIDVAADRSTFPDATFQTLTTPGFNALDTAVKTTKTEAIAMETARKALDTTWRAARQDLEKRRTEFRTLLDGWQKIVLLPWQLPTSVAPILTAARNASNPAATLAQNGDIDGAEESLTDAQTKAALELHEKGGSWRQASRTFFDRFVAADAGISTDILTSVKTASDSWRAAFPIDPAPTSDRAQVQALLRQIMGEYKTAGDHLRELPRPLQREFETVSAMLAANGADTAAIEQIGKALATLDRTLATAIDDPATASAGVQNVLDALQYTWEAAFATANNASPEVRKKVRERDYRGAADLLGADLLDETETTGAAVREALAAAFASPPHAEGASVVFGAGGVASPYAAILLDSQADIKHAKLVQTLIVGGMFFIWAMSTSSATFDGTVRGLLAAAFSAFSIDVGVDTLLARVKGTVFG
jgi:hypothetical protein